MASKRRPDDSADLQTGIKEKAFALAYLEDLNEIIIITKGDISGD